jgi:hypothetical protein
MPLRQPRAITLGGRWAAGNEVAGAECGQRRAALIGGARCVGGQETPQLYALHVSEALRRVTNEAVPRMLWKNAGRRSNDMQALR